MRVPCPLALAAVVALPLVALRAPAVEFELGWTGRAAWQSNVFRAPQDEESDFSGAMGPEVHVRQRSRALDARIDYRLFYEEFATLDGLGNFEHYLTSDATWKPTALDTFSLSHQFTRTDTLIQLAQLGVTGLAGERFVQDRETVTRNAARGEYTRQLSPLWLLTVAGDSTQFWYEDPIDSDSVSSTASVDLTRVISPRQRAGAGFAFTRQDFDDTELTNGSGTSFAQVYGLWIYEISNSVTLSGSMGPRVAFPDDLEDTAPSPTVPVRRFSTGSLVVSPSGCPAFAPGVVRLAASCAVASTVPVNASSIPLEDVEFLESRPDPDETVGFFGRASLVKRWDEMTTSLSYQRTASAASGLATSTDLDVVTLRHDWRPRRDWRLVGIAAWERQVSVSEIPLNELLLSTTPTTLFVDSRGRLVDDPMQAANTITNAGQVVGLATSELVDNAIDIRTFRLELRAEHQFTPRLSMAGFATWWRQESQGDFQSDDVITDARVELSLTWRFAPIEL